MSLTNNSTPILHKPLLQLSRRRFHSKEWHASSQSTEREFVQDKMRSCLVRTLITQQHTRQANNRDNYFLFHQNAFNKLIHSSEQQQDTKQTMG